MVNAMDKKCNPEPNASPPEIGKKQVPLRLSPQLYAAVAAWAEDDFRSVNGQIEYLLSECVRQRKKDGKYVGQQIDAPLEINIQ